MSQIEVYYRNRQERLEIRHLAPPSLIRYRVVDVLNPRIAYRALASFVREQFGIRIPSERRTKAFDGWDSGAPFVFREQELRAFHEPLVKRPRTPTPPRAPDAPVDEDSASEDGSGPR